LEEWQTKGRSIAFSDESIGELLYKKYTAKQNRNFSSINTNTMTVENIAQVAHEINRAYCESIGDTSQQSWADAPDWQRSSAINGVNFHLNNPEAPPSASHDSWLKQKEEEGWKYGEVKNPETKEHPCFVPYDQLPTEQKSKDFLFKQVVHSLKSYVEVDVE
jgi:hypothetical protein